MTFGTDLARELTFLRAQAESRMRGTCKIERPTGEQDTDPDGVVSAVFATVYTGKCYTRYPGLAQEANREVGGATVVESRIVVRIPLGPVCKPGDRVTMIADLDNPQLAGAVYRVESIDDQSQSTAQRILCSDFQGGVIS